MPLYEYKCKKCGHRFERIQSYSAEDAKECPVCQGEVERLISTPARRISRARASTPRTMQPSLLPRPSRRMEIAALTAAPLLRTKVEPIKQRPRRQRAPRLPPRPLPPANRTRALSLPTEPGCPISRSFLARCPEFPARCTGQDSVYAFLNGKAHEVRGTHKLSQEIGRCGIPPG